VNSEGTQSYIYRYPFSPKGNPVPTKQSLPLPHLHQPNYLLLNRFLLDFKPFQKSEEFRRVYSR